MTHERDIERLLDHWFANGPTEAPDRALDVIADRIDRQPQRRAWRLLWRTHNVNMNVRAVAGLAAVVILTVGVIYAIGPSSGSGVGSPVATASPSLTASPTAAPSRESISSVAFRPALRLDAPAGWVNAEDGDRSFVLLGPIRPSGAPEGELVATRDPVLGDNNSDCEGLPATGAVPSVSEIVAALSNDPRIVTTQVETVTIGGRTGQSLDLQVASSWTGTCKWSGGKPAALLLTVADPPGPFSGLSGTERVRLILLDVGESVVSIGIYSEAGPMFDAFIAKATPIVDSMKFSP
jgi:hypothetical protein